MRTYVYIAAPYMGTGTHGHQSYFAIHAHIAAAHAAALAVARLGYGFFCPHTHGAHNEVIAPDLPAAYWYELDLHFLRACDAMLVLPGESWGVAQERAQAHVWDIPVYESIDELLRGQPPHTEGTTR